MKILPVTRFKDPKTAILTLKMLTGSRLWFCKIIQEAACEKLIFAHFPCNNERSAQEGTVNFMSELNKDLISNIMFAFVLTVSCQYRYLNNLSHAGKHFFLTWKDCGGSLPLVGSFSAALPLVGSLKGWTAAAPGKKYGNLMLFDLNNSFIRKFAAFPTELYFSSTACQEINQRPLWTISKLTNFISQNLALNLGPYNVVLKDTEVNQGPWHLLFQNLVNVNPPPTKYFQCR